jgi:uncharacterized protein (TIGR00369 family)
MEKSSEKEQAIQRLAKAAESTFWGYLGCELVSVTDNQVTISLEAESHHMNIIGIVHGGVLSSLLDNAMGIAVMAARPEDKVVTTNLNVHFVSPLKEGKLLVTAEIVHQSRKMITTQGRVTDAEGNLSTIGTGSFRVI